MSIQDIKNTFNVDLKNDCRDYLHTSLRIIYTQKKRADGFIFKDIADEMNRTHGAVINLFKKYNKYKGEVLFLEIEKMYLNNDSCIVLKFKEIIKIKKRELQKTRNFEIVILKYSTVKIKVKKKKKYFKGKIDNLFTVCDVLRKEKTYLNNKVFLEWESEDWKSYFKIKNKQCQI